MTGALIDVVFIVDNSLSVPLGGSVSDATFLFEEAARRLAGSNILNRVAVARTSTQLARLVVSINGSTSRGSPAVTAGNTTAAVAAASAGLTAIRGSAPTEGTLGDTFTVVADDLVLHAANRASFTDADGNTVQSPLVIA